MNNPLISVIVPVYNVEKYLDRCVESIVNQTYTNLEIILVDDGSPDNCPQMCDAWAEKDSRIKVIHKENGGVSSARNAGIDSATGEYIGFVDSDDTIDENMYEVLKNSIVKEHVQLSVCGYKYNNKEYIPDKVKIVDSESALLLMFDNNYKAFEGFSVNKLYINSIIKNSGIRFLDSYMVCEDTLFNFNYIKLCTNVVLIDYCGYNYFIREDSATHSGKLDMDLSIYQMTDYFISNSRGPVKDTIVAWSVKFWISKTHYIVGERRNDLIYSTVRPTIKKYFRLITTSHKVSLINKLETLLISYFTPIFIIYIKIFK